ncbi:MAG: MTAP family purine nucleoside phosphorylase [Methanoregulaceae archaeon]
MLGIIGGTSLLFSSLPPLRQRKVATPFGSAEILEGDFVMLMRHQRGLPPHRVNFRANLAAMAVAGVDRIVAFGSAGSLKSGIPPGSVLIPTDYLSMSDIPSIHDHAIEHVMPKLSDEMSRTLGTLLPYVKLGGIYVQTRGPRIETVAEVQALAQFADVVGMTVASEATLACELGIDFAAICTIDNFANGIGGEVLSYEHIVETSRAYRDRTDSILNAVTGSMG